MFRNGFNFKVNDSILDQNGHYIILDLTVYEQRLTLVCLYCRLVYMFSNS